MPDRRESLGLRLVDDLAAEGIETFAARDASARLHLSPQATSNVLKRLVSSGLVDRVSPGHYVLRPIGRLGTHAASEDIALAVGALLAGEPHRIAYRSALDHHALLTHPTRTIQVATVRRVQVRRLSGRNLRIVHESPSTIRVGAELITAGAWVSSHERALIDAAARPGLTGGPTTLAEALHSRPARTDALLEITEELNASPALRRLGSLADALHIEWLAHHLQPPTRGGDIALDPTTPSPPVWRDTRWRVLWSQPPHELRTALHT